MTGPTDYASTALDQLVRLRPKTLKRLQSIRETPPKPGAVRIVFHLGWGIYNNAFVDVSLRDESNEDISPRRGFGQLLEINPPRGHENEALAFMDDRPVIAQLVFDQLSACWNEASTTPYSLPVDGHVEGDLLREYDFVRREWRTHEWGVRQTQLTNELTDLLRPLLNANIRPVLERMIAAVMAKVTHRVECSPFFLVSMENGPFEVGFWLEHPTHASRGSRSVRVVDPRGFSKVIDHESIDWPRFESAGVDRDVVLKQMLHDLLSDVWQAVNHDEITVHAILGYVIGDDFSRYDLVERRWVVDSLGRQL